MKKLINILYFNICLLAYYFGRSITVYINPFCWASNLKFLKYGFKIWKQQMEKNYPSFIHQMKYDQNLKFFSYQWFMLFLGMIIFLIIGLLQNLDKKVYTLGLVIFLITYVGTYFIVLLDNKYYEYQKEFIKDKKYNHSKTILTIWILITIVLYLLFFRKYFPIT